MSAVEVAGTQACTVAGGAQVVCNTTRAASFVAVIDATPLSGTDVLQVEIARKIRTGSTLRNVFKHKILGRDIDAGMEPIHQSVPVASAGFQFTVTLTLLVGAGTRTIEFSVEMV